MENTVFYVKKDFFCEQIIQIRRLFRRIFIEINFFSLEAENIILQQHSITTKIFLNLLLTLLRTCSTKPMKWFRSNLKDQYLNHDALN